MRFAVALWLLAATMLLPAVSRGHEIRPAYLQISEQPDGSAGVVWRQPAAGEYALSIAPWLSSGWLDQEPARQYVTDDSMVQSWSIKPPRAALAGQEVRITGLDRTITDVFVRIRYASGVEKTGLIKAARPSMIIPAERAAGLTVLAYFRLGVEHIGLGFDHLLYLLGLILLIDRLKSLVATVSAFTAAHSVTLAAAALGVLHLRPAPVEAAIALSIVCVAVELVNLRRGHPSYTYRFPWLIAFAFGLLHGFGFSSALREVGLPQDAIVSALLLFNLGIETGQLIFVTAVFALLHALRNTWPRVHARLLATVPYGIGTLASYWLLQRVAALAA